MNIPHVSEYTVNGAHDRGSMSTGYPTINGKFAKRSATYLMFNSLVYGSDNKMTNEDWIYLDKLHREFHNM